MKTETAAEIALMTNSAQLMRVCEQPLTAVTCAEIASLARGIAASAAKIAEQYEPGE